MGSNTAGPGQLSAGTGVLAYVRCPSCGLSLSDDATQRDKRCPECLRSTGQGIMMRPAAPEDEPPGSLAA